MKEFRCQHVKNNIVCNRLLFTYDIDEFVPEKGIYMFKDGKSAFFEIKCPKCGEINKITYPKLLNIA